MLGLSLIFVGFTLAHNGVCILKKVPPKNMALQNVIMGTLLLVLNLISVAGIDAAAADSAVLFGYAAQGLLFAVTYFLLAASLFFGLDFRVVGWYGLFAALNAVLFSILEFTSDGGWWFMGALWAAWFLLWFQMFLDNNCKLKFANKIGPYLLIFEGIFATWLPGLYFLFFM